MSVITWAVLKDRPVSRKIAIVRAKPLQKMTQWTFDAEYATSSGTLDDCETADFDNFNTPNETLDNVNFTEGSNSLNLGKLSGGTSGTYGKALGSQFNLTNLWAGLDLYVTDKTDFTNIRIKIGSSLFDFFEKDFASAVFTDGVFNDLLQLSGEPLADWDTTGSPDITLIDFIEILIITSPSVAAIALGRLKMDFWRFLENPINVYSVPLTTKDGANITGVDRDGTAMSVATSIVDLQGGDADRFYFDQSAQTLWISTTLAASPYQSVYVVTHNMYFSNDPTFLETITDGNVNVIPDPRINSIPKIKISNSGMVWGVSLVAKATMTLNNLDGAMDSFWNNLEWADADIDVWIGGEDLPFSEYVLFYAGRVVDDIRYSREKITINIEDKKARIFAKNNLNTFKVVATDISADFVGQAHQWRGKPAPYVYGKQLERVPILGTNVGYVLGNSITASQMTLRISPQVDAVDAATQIPAAGNMMIGGEKIVYASIDSEGLVIVAIGQRGAGGTTAATHTGGDPVYIIRANDSEVLRFNHFKGVALSSGDRGAFYMDDTIQPSPAGASYTVDTDVGPFEPDVDATGDFNKSSGDGYGSMIEQFLLDMGIPASEINSASFATLDSDINDSSQGVFFDWNDNGLNTLNDMLRSCMAYIWTNADGELEIRQWSPIIDRSALETLTINNVSDWKPYYDARRIRTQTKVLYRKQWALSNEKKWQTTVYLSPIENIIPVQEKTNSLETIEYKEGWAIELAHHVAAVTFAKQTRVKIDVMELKFIEKKPGDRLSITVGRPWGDTAMIFEIETIHVSIGKGTVKITLDVHDVFGLQDRVRAMTDETGPTWANATATERDTNVFIADDDGFVVPGDLTTLNHDSLY